MGIFVRRLLAITRRLLVVIRRLLTEARKLLMDVIDRLTVVRAPLANVKLFLNFAKK